jgi:hypothetical protein
MGEGRRQTFRPGTNISPGKETYLTILGKLYRCRFQVDDLDGAIDGWKKILDRCRSSDAMASLLAVTLGTPPCGRGVARPTDSALGVRDATSHVKSRRGSCEFAVLVDRPRAPTSHRRGRAVASPVVPRGRSQAPADPLRGTYGRVDAPLPRLGK